MMKRNATLAFLGGFYVFPGGGLKEEDSTREAGSRVRGFTERDAAAILGAGVENPHTALGFWLAGIRELFEEAGVLLAEDGRGAPVSVAGREEWCAGLQGRVHGGEPFWRVLRDQRLYYAASGLEYIDHWITPEFSPIRFDTRFFTARLPAGQAPSPHAGESSEGLWIKPKEALRLCDRGEMPMIPPTIATLNRLSA